MSDKPLDQFLVSAKSLTDVNSAAEIICRIVDSPNVYSFSDLLEVPLIASMKNLTEYKKYFDLLLLFSYGTYQDYLKNQSSLPKLNPIAIMKLRHLSIISMAGKCRIISYNVLSTNLDIKNIRDLEDLIIEAFYLEIIKGKLDQANDQLEIDFAIGRDVTNEQVDDILAILNNWCNNCDIALKTIETQIKQANSHKQNNIDLQTNIDAEVANLKKSIKFQCNEVEALNNSNLKDLNKKGAKKGNKAVSSSQPTK